MKSISNQMSEKESILTSISDNLADGMIYRLVTNDKGERKFTYLSGSFQKIYGHTPEEGMADPSLIFGRVLEEDVQSLLDAEAESKRNLSTYRCEVRMKNPDGTIRFSKFVSTPKVMEGGSICWDGIELDITDLKKAQTDLQQSQFLLETIANGTPDGIFAKDLDGRYLFVNSVMAKHANKSPEEFLGKDNSAFFPADQVKKAWTRDLEVLKSGEIQTFEEQYITSSGDDIIFLTTKGPIKDVHGETIGLFGIAVDITELKKTQADLKRSQFLMQSITDGLPDSIFAKDLNGNFTFVNSALTKRFNKSAEELLGNDINSVFSPDVSNLRKAMDVKIIKDGKTRTFEEQETTPSGSVVYLATKGAIKDEQGNTIGLFGIDRDITALKNTQEELQQNQFLLKSVADGLPDSIFAKDLDGRYLFVNSAGAKRSNMSPEDLLGKDNSVIFPKDEANKTRDMDFQIMKSGRTKTFEEQLTTSSGDVIYLTTKGPIKNTEGKTVGLFGIARDITERKKSEEALRVSQEKFEFAFNSSPNAILIQDIRTGKYTEANASTEKIFGYSQEEVVGKTSLELNLYKDIAVRKRAIEVFNDQGYIRNMEVVGLHASGTDLHLLLTVQLHYVDNKPFMYIDLQDVTEQKRSEEVLRISQKKFEFAFNSSPNAILIQNELTRKILEVNESNTRIFGHSREEALAKTPFELNLYKDPSSREKLFEILKKQGYVQNMEIVGLHKSGADLYLLVTIERYYVDNDPYLYVNIQDVTEQKKKEEALRISQKKFEFAFNSSPDAISIQDEQTGKFMEVNVSTSKVFGYSKEEFFSKTPLELNLYKDAAFRGKVHEILEAQGTVRNMEVLCLNKYGEDVPILLTVERHFVDSKPVLFINGHDIRERKQVELELQKLNLDKDRFISILGHDLRGPVNSIVGLLDLMHENIVDMDMEEIKEITDLVYLSAKNTSKLLDDVLLWATAKSGKMKFNPQIINFKEECQGVVELLQFAATAKNIAIETHCELCEDSLEIYADKNMLNTMLRNLISNALKFTYEDGKITIKAEKTTEKTVVSIADNGVGIDSKDVNKIFDKAQLFTLIGTNEEKGTGFGLKLCQEFVEKHGGEIWVESEVGKGTTFYFSLPNAI
ncbi:PAS domain S-box protein [Flavobacterium granuli]|uniref:histidine kinase n=1 Tax=Flavobacterium granuli TaxID=280093 RepID=A0ABU1RZC0_9FLAO|nr:PAS domain S-box protein [Flavobacterium granuli]MDR6844108.1 PAS domain S-box-containing protein [Flavobacterium granuli]